MLVASVDLLYSARALRRVAWAIRPIKTNTTIDKRLLKPFKTDINAPELRARYHKAPRIPHIQIVRALPHHLSQGGITPAVTLSHTRWTIIRCDRAYILYMCRAHHKAHRHHIYTLCQTIGNVHWWFALAVREIEFKKRALCVRARGDSMELLLLRCWWWLWSAPLVVFMQRDRTEAGEALYVVSWMASVRAIVRLNNKIECVVFSDFIVRRLKSERTRKLKTRRVCDHDDAVYMCTFIIIRDLCDSALANGNKLV